MEFDLYTATELAQKTGVIKARLLGWVSTGKLLPIKKIGSQYVFDEAAFEKARKLRDGDGLQPKPQHLFTRIAVDAIGYVPKAEAATAIGVTQETLMRWAATGQLQAYKREGRERVLFARDDVDRLAAERHSGKAA